MKLNNVDFETYFRNYPDVNGYFGRYGGVFIEEKLKKPMAEIFEFQLKDSIMGSIPGIGAEGSVGGGFEGEEGWE